MSELEKLFGNQVFLSIILLVIGGVISLLFSKISNKTSVFQYLVSSTKVGVSTDDELFGSVRSTWQGHEMRNLYISTIEIENSSSKDFEDIKFKVYSGSPTFLLNQRTEIANTPYIIPWEKTMARESRFLKER